MTHEAFKDAVREAKLFLDRAKLVKWNTHPPSDRGQGYTHLVGFTESASLKRQSMELTRALARLRKP